MSKEGAEKAPINPGDGIRSMRSTSVFRALNFELYAKPVSCHRASEVPLSNCYSTDSRNPQNMIIMALGLTCFGGTLGYIAYMRAQYESQGYYGALQSDGTEVFTKRKSKWD